MGRTLGIDDRIRLYLTAIAAGCAEVATTLSPKIVDLICGVLQLAPRTMWDIELEAAEAYPIAILGHAHRIEP